MTTEAGPNGELLKISVGVSYRSEPEAVMALLQAVAAAHPDVLKDPAPEVSFDAFGPRALEFTLHAALASGAVPQRTGTALRLTIWKVFKAAGIELPYDQLDIHMRDLDAVRDLVARALATRASPTGGTDDGPAST